jgi:hypothetical protein
MSRLHCWAAALLAVPAIVTTSPASVLAQEVFDSQGGDSGPSAPRTVRTLDRIDAILAESQGLQRALNLSRATAIQLNGGLGLYRPANCMFAGISNNPCLIDRGEKGFVFRFGGGPPGWEQFQLPAIWETEILVSLDGRDVLQVLYNGPARAAQATEAATEINPNSTPNSTPLIRTSD